MGLKLNKKSFRRPPVFRDEMPSIMPVFKDKMPVIKPMPKFKDMPKPKPKPTPVNTTLKIALKSKANKRGLGDTPLGDTPLPQNTKTTSIALKSKGDTPLVEKKKAKSKKTPLPLILGGSAILLFALVLGNR